MCWQICAVARYYFGYTLSYFYFYNNFGKCGSILIVLSLSHSQMNCRKSWHKIYHLTSNLLPHYLTKIECLIVKLVHNMKQCPPFASTEALSRSRRSLISPIHSTSSIYHYHAYAWTSTFKQLRDKIVQSRPFRVSPGDSLISFHSP